jgi:hypothetical protein
MKAQVVSQDPDIRELCEGIILDLDGADWAVTRL